MPLCSESMGSIRHYDYATESLLDIVGRIKKVFVIFYGGKNFIVIANDTT